VSDCIRLWRGLGEGSSWASLTVCRINDDLRLSLSWFYEGDYGTYMISRELREYAHSWEDLLRRASEDSAGLWRQALEDIAREYGKKGGMETVLRLAQAVLQAYR
jgi:hypothetical protein